jgi:glycosyltransferase involved in cell wall biosynthesis
LSKKAQRHKGTKAQSGVLYLALPCLDEIEYIPSFISCLRKQSLNDYELVVCVNQPDHWWEDPAKKHVCLNNQQTLEYLQDCNDLPITVIDRTSPGLGWKGSHDGVGWARKTAMDAIAHIASANDIIVSIDADTVFREDYLESVRATFQKYPHHAALAVPYYHLLTGDEITDRCILRYEIYMRYYALNMWRIANPYKFTAIGSAMACPVWAYRAVGGITPHKSGEDFYFLQKLAKFGKVIHWNSEWVYPAARFSDRVFFGTGPAMIKGRDGNWDSYPIFNHQFFNDIMTTFNHFQDLYDRELETPMSEFLRMIFKTSDLWGPFRENYKTRDQFVQACIRKVDGLRILQYLKYRQKTVIRQDEENLRGFIQSQYHEIKIRDRYLDMGPFDFQSSTVETLNTVRDFLQGKEEEARRTENDSAI